MFVGLIEFEKVYDTVSREILYQVLRMYDISGKLLNGIKSMHVNYLACVSVNRSESKCFSIDRRVR